MKIYVWVLLSFWSINLAQADSGPPTAREAADAWLMVLDQGDFEKTWGGTSPEFQSQVSLKKWAASAKRARNPLGDFLSRKMTAAVYRDKLPNAPAGDYLIFQYKSKFTKKKDAVETVTQSLVDGKWKISGYFVR